MVTPGLPLISFAQGVQPLSRPDGSLVLVYDVFTDPGVDVVAASRSNDGGSTFSAPLTISRLQSEPILGLRALYFLLANLLGMFRYLHVGLAVVLAFVSIKMLAEEPLSPYLEAIGLGAKERIFLSLGMIGLILSVAIVCSILAGPKEPLEHPAEEVIETPTAAPHEAAAHNPERSTPEPPPRQP